MIEKMIECPFCNELLSPEEFKQHVVGISCPKVREEEELREIE